MRKGEIPITVSQFESSGGMNFAALVPFLSRVARSLGMKVYHRVALVFLASFSNPRTQFKPWGALLVGQEGATETRDNCIF